MKKSYDEYRDMLNGHLLDCLPAVDSRSSTLSEAMEYSLTAGGKRLRPVLLMASCELAGGDPREALPYACAIEYIHTYSLIHDDLPAMDDDAVRRGRPTSHIVFGAGPATLAGDALLNTAFEAMGSDMLLYSDDGEALKRRVRAMCAIARGAGIRGMLAGQISDIENDSRPCSAEMLDHIHRNKTAALIVAAVRAGLYIGGADEALMDDMTDYAEKLGLAFQIADDILDVKGDAHKMGKNTGRDAGHNKNTYVSLHGMEAAERRLKELTRAAAAAAAPYKEAGFFRELALKLAERDR